jgi:hypothetical protein
VFRAARLVSVAFVLAACKPASTTREPGATPGTPASSPDASSPEGPGASEAPRCASDGEPWDGKPGTCFYEHAGCCYPTPEAMCAAAGCDAASCMIMESSPAQARCADPPPAS